MLGFLDLVLFHRFFLQILSLKNSLCHVEAFMRCFIAIFFLYLCLQHGIEVLGAQVCMTPLVRHNGNHSHSVFVENLLGSCWPWFDHSTWLSSAWIGPTVLHIRSCRAPAITALLTISSPWALRGRAQRCLARCRFHSGSLRR